MDINLVRRSTIVLAGFVGLAGLTACEDKRVKNLDTGITRDSALTVLAQDMRKTGGSDSLPNVYTREAYLIAGKNYEVLYYSANNEKAVKDTVPFKRLTPIVLIDNKVIGRGWDFWDSVSTANKIPLKKRD